MRDAVFYQIFVDRFYRGNYEKDDTYIDMEWGGKPTPKNFAGGDLRGIIEKLEYLKDLGITAIYMTPIFQSKSNHKYDISDYRKVDSEFGSLEDLRELVQKAHALGMRVVLDAVFNHCSEQLPEFADVMEKGKESPYYDWFLIDGDYPLPQEGNYECFASCAYMPKFNTASVAVQDYLIDIATYWIREADIDGWRLDVSDEVSHEFWRRFRQAVKQEKQDCVIIGENWHDAYPYLMGDQYDSIMNYAFTKACLDYFAKGKFSGEDMANQLNHILMRNTEPVNRMMLNLLDSHDTHRFFTEVGCNKDKLLAAVALNVMFPGATCIYYGTEICMEGGYDPDSRRCFDWDKSKWNMDAWNAIRELLHFKQTNTLGYGTVFLKGDGSCLYMERKDETACYRLWIHLGTEAVEIPDQNEVLLSHGYRNGALAVGYVITREEYL
ncbi:MAG: glycoside hydrolase family 13 protein, partial [Lachnospiraceae bacterium]|nr:glycoside hydrolase family 13 protein [Lachnospiraceae bacterium]